MDIRRSATSASITREAKLKLKQFKDVVYRIENDNGWLAFLVDQN